MDSLWATTNPVFRQYALCSGLLGVKVLGMSYLTARQRFAKKAFSNPEDSEWLAKVAPKDDPNVERVRRAHLNDLENVPVFWTLGLIYVLTDPTEIAAKVCLYGFTAARFLHTVTYLYGVQPYRALSFSAGQFINIYMAIVDSTRNAILTSTISQEDKLLDEQ